MSNQDDDIIHMYEAYELSNQRIADSLNTSIRYVDDVIWDYINQSDDEIGYSTEQ